MKLLGGAIITAVFAVLGEFIIRRNRRDRAERARLAAEGVPVQGRVHTLAKVTAGKYGSYKLRAEIRYTVAGTEHTHIAAWWPQEAAHLAQGAPIELLVDPSRPGTAVVAGSAAPDLEKDSVWRWMTAGVAIVAVLLAVLS